MGLLKWPAAAAAAWGRVAGGAVVGCVLATLGGVTISRTFPAPTFIIQRVLIIINYELTPETNVAQSVQVSERDIPIVKGYTDDPHT